MAKDRPDRRAAGQERRSADANRRALRGTHDWAVLAFPRGGKRAASRDRRRGRTASPVRRRWSLEAG